MAMERLRKSIGECRLPAAKQVECGTQSGLSESFALGDAEVNDIVITHWYTSLKLREL